MAVDKLMASANWASPLEYYTVHLTEFEGLILYDAVERERKLLEIVTAKEREAGNRDGWALARIKVRSLRRVVSQLVVGKPRKAGEGYRLDPEDEAALADQIAAVGQKMRPPRAELEKLMSVKARRRTVVRRTKPVPSANVTEERGGASAVHRPKQATSKGLAWAIPKVAEHAPDKGLLHSPQIDSQVDQPGCG